MTGYGLQCDNSQCYDIELVSALFSLKNTLLFVEICPLSLRWHIAFQDNADECFFLTIMTKNNSIVWLRSYDDNIYMKLYKQLQCEKLIGLWCVVFSLLQQLKKSADSLLLNSKFNIFFFFGFFSISPFCSISHELNWRSLAYQICS